MIFPYLQNALNYVSDNRVVCGGGYHIIINSVSYINGQMIQTGFDEMNAYCNFITQVTE
ncbi:MAG: hypothetical protein IJY19_11415 [Ruminococcus sp.]|nr:hypothetical protein [Ruminococcus sp.]